MYDLLDQKTLSQPCYGVSATHVATPLSWLGAIRPTSANDAFDPALWETFVSSTLGLEVSILAALPRLHNSPLAKCGCKKFCMDFHGDHTSTCTAHSGATKAHDWMVSVIGRLFRTAGHVVRTRHGVTASAGKGRGDVEVRIISGIRPGAGAWSLIPPPACTASFCVFFFYRRLRHTSLPLECHRKPTTRKHSGSSARHSTKA